MSERDTSNVAVSEIAEAADVSRQLLYHQFGDRDTLLLEAALDLARRELVPHLVDPPETASEGDRLLVTVRHFAEHRLTHSAGTSPRRQGWPCST